MDKFPILAFVFWPWPITDKTLKSPLKRTALFPKINLQAVCYIKLFNDASLYICKPKCHSRPNFPLANRYILLSFMSCDEEEAHYLGFLVNSADGRGETSNEKGLLKIMSLLISLLVHKHLIDPSSSD